MDKNNKATKEEMIKEKLLQLDKEIELFYEVYLRSQIIKINKINERNSNFEIYASNDNNKTSIKNLLTQIEQKIQNQFLDIQNEHIFKYHALTKLIDQLEQLDILHCKRDEYDLFIKMRNLFCDIQSDSKYKISIEFREIYEAYITS